VISDKVIRQCGWGAATHHRATVKRRQFTGRHLTGATMNCSDNLPGAT